VGENDFPLRGGEFVNGAPPDNVALRALPLVNGITVNTVHGNERTIATLRERLAPRDAGVRRGGAADMPRVETMEGAAFMYACLVHGLPFAQVRAVSNFVERRNREAWRIPEAVAALNASALELLDHV
jgi:futalosine hydrolase